MSLSAIDASYVGYAGHASGDWAWVMARSGNFDTKAGRAYVEMARHSGEYDERRGFIQFDTSSIPAAATVSAATLRVSMDYTDKTINGGMYIVPSTMDWNSVAGVSLWSASNLGYISTANVPSGSTDITLTTASVTKASYTKFVVVHSSVFNNSAPGYGSDLRDLFWVAGVGETLPQIRVTWTTVPVVTTGTATSITPIAATLGGNITDAGGGTVSTAGVCWSVTINPTTSDSKTATATTSGAFTVAATGLLPGTLYHYRAYVTTENSTTYGADTTFRTINSGNFIAFL